MPDTAAIAILPARDRGPSIQTTFLRGIAWTGVARWFTQALTWASTLVVARVLAPEDYGIVASAVVFTGFVAIVSEFGVGLTIVTLRDLTRAQIAQLNGLSIALGVVAFAIVAGSAPVVAALYARPALTPVIVVIATTFPLAGLRTVPAALLQRDLRFRYLAAIESLQAIAGAATTLIAALHAWAYWSLVAGMVSGACLWTAMSVAACRVPCARPRRRTLAGALTFTRHQLTGTIAWYGYSNADFVVAGRLLGAAPLGVYSMAWTIARIVPERVAAIVMRLTPAFFSAIQHDRAALRNWLYRLTEAVSVVTFPALIGLAVIAGDAVPLVAGPRWAAAVLPVRLLAVYGAFDVSAQLITRALIAAGDSRFVARLGLMLLLGLPPAFVVAAGWGPSGIALAWVAVTPVIRSVLWRRAKDRLGVQMWSYLHALWPAASGTLVMSVAVVSAGIGARSWPLAARTLFEVSAGAGVYVATVWLLHRDRVSAWRREWTHRSAS